MRTTIPLLLVLSLSCSSVLDADAPAWRKLAASGPSARWGHAAAIDAARERMLVFGGQSEAGELADLWSLDLATETWTLLDAPGGPSHRVNPIAFVDAARDRMIVLGGRTGLGTLYDDAWALDLAHLTWTALPKGPGPRQRAHFAQTGDHAWVYGGEGLFQVFGDLWQLDFATDTWQRLPDAGDVPPARTCGAMALDGNGLLVHGGHDVAIVRDGTWRYDLDARAWSQVSTQGSTAAGAHWAYATDAACGNVYLAGGDHVDNYDTALTDTLSLSSRGFQKLRASALPDPHDHATLVFDAKRRDLVLFGGTLGDGQSYLGGAWVYPVPACR